MKRFCTMLIIMLLLSYCAAADGALSKSFPAPMTAGTEQTSEKWLEDEEQRALLTACLWLDYAALTDVEPCPAAGLVDSLVAKPANADYLLTVISTESGRLTMYFLPSTGEASYLWEGGDYGMDVKAEALRNHGMTVWLNDATAVVRMLEMNTGDAYWLELRQSFPNYLSE